VGIETTTYPMTIGQLSVFRDIEEMPAERLWEANLQPQVWDIRQDCTVEDVWTALGALAMRHESLRTNYLVDESGSPRQLLAVDDAATVMARVDHGVADIAELPELQMAKYQQILDIYHGIPWRAWVLTDEGGPRKLLVVVHHMAADGAGALILQDDFHALLARRELPPPGGQPIAMALDQQGAGAARLRTAERYWRRTLDAAPRRSDLVAPNAEMLGATLHTGVPVELGHARAAKVNASLASVVLAAYYHALRQVTGHDDILVMSVSANRFDASTAGVVTSLTQWVPLLLSFDGTESFDELAAKVHWKSFNGLKNGICDPDAIVRMREEFFELADPPVDPGYNLNTILAPPGFAPEAESQPASTEFYTPARATGPGFYLIASGIETIDVVVRVNRPDIDRSALAAILAVMGETLRAAAGLPSES
jgi:hypothetical protein